MAEPQIRPSPVAPSGKPSGLATSLSVLSPAAEPPAEPARAAPAPRFRAALITAVVLAALWAAFTPGDAASWWLGVPAVLGGAAIPLLLPRPDRARLRLSPRGAVAFAVYFAVHSVHGAVDVAWRACQRRMPIEPGFKTYTMRLPDGPAQLVMANAITLLPGTLSAEVHGPQLTVHMLDRTQDLSADLAVLEARVAALFGLAMPVTDPLA